MTSDKTNVSIAQDEPVNDLTGMMTSLAEDFTATANHAANWKVNYFGATASARLFQAVADMELATARIRVALT